VAQKELNIFQQKVQRILTEVVSSLPILTSAQFKVLCLRWIWVSRYLSSFLSLLNLFDDKWPWLFNGLAVFSAVRQNVFYGTNGTQKTSLTEQNIHQPQTDPWGSRLINRFRKVSPYRYPISTFTPILLGSLQASHITWRIHHWVQKCGAERKRPYCDERRCTLVGLRWSTEQHAEHRRQQAHDVWDNRSSVLRRNSGRVHHYYVRALQVSAWIFSQGSLSLLTGYYCYYVEKKTLKKLYKNSIVII